MDRRRFLTATAATSLSLATATRRAAGANDRITVAVAGVRGRGGTLLKTFAAHPDVDVKYVCDVDQRAMEQRVASLAKSTEQRPRAIKDFRKALDDKSLDALVLGTPDHWHAIPTIMACQAEKDVYVEKPDGHDVTEGHTMVAAARKYKRVVQLGTQSRSKPAMIRAMEYIGSGKLGRVQFAKGWESSRQGSIGHTPDSPTPEGVDYDLWLGPAPKRPFNKRRFHGTWRWFFDYGTGDLGNDGVHLMDMARWGLQNALAAEGKTLPDLPRSVSSTGGKYYFDDDQEWPDTLMVSYDYPGCVLTYEMRLWSAYRLEGEVEGAAVLGDKGSVILGHTRWRAFDAKGKLLVEEKCEAGNDEHVANFIDCMRSRKRPAADLETVGHPSSMLCHLGNAAWRAGRPLRFDPKTCTAIGDDDANQYLARPSYRQPWVLPKLAEL